MCVKPNDIDGQLVACRECDQCIAARKNNWVARACAEKAVAGVAYKIELTYAPLPDGSDPVGARVFNYDDVRLFHARVRAQFKDRYGYHGGLRFMACGEKGSSGTNRVHWHNLYFADQSLAPLGSFTDMNGKKMAKPKYGYNMNWSLWPHGFCHWKIADQQAIAYAAIYALKDSLTVKKSKHAKRLPKANNWGSSYFAMSKRPPIGWPFVERYLSQLEEMGSVPVSPNIKVPGYSGYMYLTGNLRSRFLQRVQSINNGIKQRTGKDAPQWAALISKMEARDSDKDLEDLYYGQIEEPNTGPDQHLRDYKFQQELRSDVDKRRLSAASIVKRCSGILPCHACEVGMDESDRERAYSAHRREYLEFIRALRLPYQWNAGPTEPSNVERFDRWWRDRGQCSRFCALRDRAEVRDAFENQVPYRRKKTDRFRKREE